MQGCVEGGPLGGSCLQQQQHQSFRREQTERILQQQLAIDRRFCAEHAETDAAGLAATLAETALEPADAAVAGTTGIPSFDVDVASGLAQFSIEPGGIMNRRRSANRSRILLPITVGRLNYEFAIIFRRSFGWVEGNFR